MKWFFALFLAGCINDDRRLYEVELTGEIVAPVGQVGKVRIVYQQRERTAPEPLVYPLVPFESLTENAPGPVTHKLLVPSERGSGLVVYAWLDSNADGELCRPGTPAEPAGLVEVSGYPAHALSYRLELNSPCAGAETLYPPRR
jgi:hypothetical protein